LSFIFWGENLFFTFLSIKTFTVKSKLRFMISVKIQSIWYFSLLYLVKIWVIESNDVGVVCVVIRKRVLGEEEEVDFFPPWPVGPTCFVLYAVSIVPHFQICTLFLYFCFCIFFFSSFDLFIYLFFLLSISRNMQHYFMPFLFFYFPLFILFSLFLCYFIFSFFIYLLYLVFFISCIFICLLYLLTVIF